MDGEVVVKKKVIIKEEMVIEIEIVKCGLLFIKYFLEIHKLKIFSSK